MTIFDILKRFNKKETFFYDNLSDEDKKQFNFFMIMKWLSGTKSAGQITLLNHICNKYQFSLKDHKGLLSNLFTIAVDGNNYIYKFIKEVPKSTNYPMAIDVISDFYTYSKKDSIEILPLLKKDDILIMAEESGKDDTFINKLKKEIASLK